MKNAKHLGERGAPQVLLGILSVIGAFVVAYYVSMTFDSGSFLRRLISPSDSMIENAVPFTIILLWMWTMLDVGVKALLDWMRQRQLGELRKITEGCRDQEIHCVLNAVDKDASRARFAFVRIADLARQLNLPGSRERAHEHYRHQLEIDADQAAGSYTLAKVYIWAMPIVGFIGTVIGIGLAVAEFSSFLTADMGVEDIQKVKGALAEVAGGLSFAFDTTLLGLTASLVAMLVMSFVQRSEESFFSGLEELGLGVITTWGGGPAAGAVDMDIAELKGRLQETVAGLDRTLTDFGGGLVSQIDGLGRAISPLSGRVTASMEMLRGSVEAKAAEIERIRLQGETIGGRVEQGVAGMTRQLEQLRDILAGLREDLNTRMQADRGLADDTRAHVDARIVDLLDRIGHELRTSLDTVRRDANRLGTGPVAWPRWAGIGAGVGLLLLATGAGSMVIGLQRIEDMTRVVHDGDQALSSRITELAGSLDQIGGSGTIPPPTMPSVPATVWSSPEIGMGAATSTNEAAEQGASEPATTSISEAEARPNETVGSAVLAGLVAGSPRPADPGSTGSGVTQAASVVPPIERTESNDPASTDPQQVQALSESTLIRAPAPSPIAPGSESPPPGSRGAAPGGTTQVAPELAQPQDHPAAGASSEPLTLNAVPAAVPTEPDPFETPIAAWLQEARSALEKQYLLTPADQSAFHWTSRVLDLDPANAEALALRGEMLQRYLGWAETSIGRGSLDAARHNLQKADRLADYGSDNQLASLGRLKKQVSELSRPRPKPAPARAEQPRTASSTPVESKRQGEAMAALEPPTSPTSSRAPETSPPRQSEPANPIKAVTDQVRAAGGEIKQAWKRVMESMP
ncbi:MotA/TolQ/ExbB proton channel family protein [Thiocapsa marina]|uniref:MotA/TolQ/ExbB proton channel n=1 Tax=Thiocapsa marina 5811 TaxID=768671 RepID=F9UHP9_9GAMM|nr:MotA/TolQ/ExbB proton channel family protein [Thiocapsa marina]EGV16225.1 MotA/TolQ/ExbB proton channel [Thiocapsa marina 5811]